MWWSSNSRYSAGARKSSAGKVAPVHMLIDLPPTQMLSPLVNGLKTVGSRLLRK